MIESAQYKGNNGIYASVSPTQSTVNELVRAEITGVSPIDWHVTVLYDEKFSPDAHEVFRVYTQIGCDVTYKAIAKDIVCWHTPNEGVVEVLELESPQLELLHSYLRKTLGVNHSFDEYKPHLTLKYDLDFKPPNPLLAGKVLTFGGLRFEDIK